MGLRKILHPIRDDLLKILQACGHTRLVDISKDILDGYVKSVPATSLLESLPKTGITPRYVQDHSSTYSNSNGRDRATAPPSSFLTYIFG